MQLQSLLSFFGSPNPTQVDIAGRGSDAKPDSSGFGSMLSAAFGLASNRSMAAESGASADGTGVDEATKATEDQEEIETTVTTETTETTETAVATEDQEDVEATETTNATDAVEDVEAHVAATTSDDLKAGGIVSDTAAGSAGGDAAERSTVDAPRVSEDSAGVSSGDGDGDSSTGDKSAASRDTLVVHRLGLNDSASAASVDENFDQAADSDAVKSGAGARGLKNEGPAADREATRSEKADGTDRGSATDRTAASDSKAATDSKAADAPETSARTDAAKASSRPDNPAHITPAPSRSDQRVTRDSAFTAPDSENASAAGSTPPGTESTTLSTDPRTSAGKSAGAEPVHATSTQPLSTPNPGQASASALHDQHALNLAGSEGTDDVPAEISVRAARAEGRHKTESPGDLDRGATAHPSSIEQMRVADLKRASHRLPVEQMRVWQEGSTAAHADGDASATKPTAQVASGTAVLEPETPSPAAAANPQASAGTDVVKNLVDGASHPLLTPDETVDLDVRTETDRPESRAGGLAKDGGTGTAMQGEAGAGSDPGNGSPNTTAGGFELDEKGLAAQTDDFDVMIQDDGAVPDVEQAVDAPTEAAAEELAIASERASTPAAPASLESARRAGRPLHAGNAAWLNSLLSDRLGTLSLDEGWKVLEMQLEEGQGTMTVRARRDEDKVSISVAFSDPQMRALAAENADRLRETMRVQYETTVDFSLSSDSAGESPQQRGDGHRERDASSGRAPRADVVSTIERASVTRAALAGARNEWIG